MNVTELVAAICLILATGCTQARPKFSEGETNCLSKVETNEDIDLAKCADPEMTEAESDTCVDTIMDHYDEEAEQCLREY